MPTTSIPDYTVTTAWTNILAANPQLANKDCIAQLKDEGVIYMVFEGAQPASDHAGAVTKGVLAERLFNGATAVWVRTDKSAGLPLAIWTL